jgi:hypothetical protein
VNPFDMVEIVENFKGTISSKPFKDYPAGRKNHPNRNVSDTAYAAYVLVAHQIKGE